MSMSEIIARQLDHELYDHPGRETTVTYAIRKYQDRPALKVGDKVTVIRFARVEGNYGPEPRLLVRNADGAERWIPATNVSLGDEINAESAPKERKTLVRASETRPVREANPARNVPAEPASETPIRRFAVETDGERIYLREVAPTFAFPLNWLGREGLTREQAWSYVRAQPKPVTVECLGEEPMDLGVVFDTEAFERRVYGGYVSYGQSMSDGYYGPMSFESWVKGFRKNPHLDGCDVSEMTRDAFPTYLERTR